MGVSKHMENSDMNETDSSDQAEGLHYRIDSNSMSSRLDGLVFGGNSRSNSKTFECDPQRLAKLDRRFANGEAPPSLHHVETSESDNSQSETIQVDNTSQEPQKVTLNTPDNTINKRNRKRKQDTPVDARGAIRPMKNQRPINAYFEPNETMKTPNAGKSSNANNRADNNGVSRNLLGVNDSSSDYGVTLFENGTNTSTSTGTAASTGVTASVVAAP